MRKAKRLGRFSDDPATNVIDRISLCRLIEAGGGRVLWKLKAPYRGLDVKVVQYAICEDEKSKDTYPFKRAGIPVLHSETIIDYITKVGWTIYLFHYLHASFSSLQ